MLWEKTFGGENFEAGRSLKQTADNGYIIIGHTESFGNGNNDAYLLRLIRRVMSYGLEPMEVLELIKEGILLKLLIKVI